MRRIFICSLVLGLLTIFGCGSNAPAPINDNKDRNSTVPIDPKSVDLKVKMGWGRAEQHKSIGTASYNSLFGVIRTEISDGNQTVIIHYSTDGINWLLVYGKNNGLTEDSNFTKFYFQTPDLVTDTNLVSSVQYQFYVEYRTDTETNFSDEGAVFKCSTRPDKSLPDGVIGQAAPGYFHLVLENAKLIPVYNPSGTWVSNSFQGHIQVKNDGKNSVFEVRIMFLTNRSDWDQAVYRSYDFILAQKLVKSFYSNNNSNGIQDWIFSVMMPRSVTNINFINGVSNKNTGDYWEDKNRCIRYWINTVPGVMISHQTNYLQR